MSWLLTSEAAAILGIAAIVAALWLVNRLSERYYAAQWPIRHQLLMLTLTVVAVGAIVLISPFPGLDMGHRITLLQVLGGLLGAAIALSSTTFLGNAMAGLMLRSVRSFRSGDFLRVGDHFGRVSERGLFHVEIQSEDRDLTTLPNLFLVTNPVTVTRSSGAFVSAVVSLGYDVPRRKVEGLLCEAAAAVGLEEAFVQVVELGDYSISYRVAGLLKQVRRLITARSELRGEMIDALHRGGIEIVSPAFMNTRALAPSQPVVPPAEPSPAAAEEPARAPEKLMFDKADEAESLEKLEAARDKVVAELKELAEKLAAGAEGAEREELESRRQKLEAGRERLAELIEGRKAEKGGK